MRCVEAMIAAAVVSAMLIYSAATFDQTMKPSRGVLLLSFAVFLPVSLAYRRWIRQYVVASSAGRSCVGTTTVTDGHTWAVAAAISDGVTDGPRRGNSRRRGTPVR